LRHWIQLVLQHRSTGRIGQRHPVDPALPAIRAQDQPIDAVALQQLDFVTLVENANLPGAELVRRVEEADQPVTDIPAFEVLERPDAGGLEGKARRSLGGSERVRAANLLQRGPSPARQERLIDGLQAGSGVGFVPDSGRRGEEPVVRLVIVTSPLAEEGERRPGCRPRTGSGDGGQELGHKLIERRRSTAIQVGHHGRGQLTTGGTLG
jgi:hypothetical protein